MRHYSIIFSIIVFSFSSFAQKENKTKLIIPSDDFFKSRNTLKDTLDELTFSYLKTYYKIKGKRHLTWYNGFRYENWPCHWYQKFSKGIVYEYDSCITSGFVSTIIFSNVTKNDVILLVESLYKSENNEWNKEKTLYDPKQKEIRCSHEIQVKDGKIILRNCRHC